MLLGAPLSIQWDLVHPDHQPALVEADIGVDVPASFSCPELSAPNGCGHRAGG
jgi:hypothetical protein